MVTKARHKSEVEDLVIKVRVRKLGKCVIITLPKVLCDGLELKVGETVTIEKYGTDGGLYVGRGA